MNLESSSARVAPQDNDAYVVPALQRGLDLLACFTRHQPLHTGADLSRILDLPRASVFRMLHTLARSGFVEKEGDGPFYKLSIGVLRLGFEYLSSMELTEHGRPIIEELRDRSGYSAHLIVRDQREAVVVAKATGTSTLFQGIQVGARLPVHATVVGRVLLVGMDLSDLRQLYPEERLQVFTPMTPQTVVDLKQMIDETYKAGYAISQGGYDAGISTIAAPVRNDRFEVLASVSLAIPAPVITPEQSEALVSLVLDAAEQLTERMSHLPRVETPVRPGRPPIVVKAGDHGQ